jgi:hypothetical protein
VFVGHLQNYLPLPQGGGYPLFKNYPTETVEYSAKQRAKIIMEEELARKKAESLEILKTKTAYLLQREIQFRE